MGIYALPKVYALTKCTLLYFDYSLINFFQSLSVHN